MVTELVTVLVYVKNVVVTVCQYIDVMVTVTVPEVVMVVVTVVVVVVVTVMTVVAGEKPLTAGAP